MRGWPVFPLVPALGSTHSAAGCPALFAGFIATMAESDFSGPFIIGFGSSPSRCGPAAGTRAAGQTGDLPVPVQGACVHARFYDHAGSDRALAITRPSVLPSAYANGVGTQDKVSIAAQWLACTFPCRRFADTSRMPAHDSGPMWFAIPSSQWTCTTYSLPVSRRTPDLLSATHAPPVSRWDF